ncbi:MAG: hypothetical protein Q4B43_10635 [Bacteroidota bacterium]|nr:hypothetical protein [Bacteroidota bacterium]
MKKFLILISMFLFFKINAQNTENELIILLKEIENSEFASEERNLLEEQFILKFQQIIEDNQTLHYEELEQNYIFVNSYKSTNKKYLIYSIGGSKISKHYNFVLQLNEEQKYAVLYKSSSDFYHFKEIHDLGNNHFLIIQQLDDLSFSCYEAQVFSAEKEQVVLKNAFRKNDEKLSVCSFTRVVGLDGMEYYAPIKINFDPKNKEIFYSFKTWNPKKRQEKTITRKTKYKKGKFNILDYDERIFE